jgi:pilus assembly protein FimV
VLEKTVRDLQRTIELKNESLAQVQSQAESAKGKSAEPAKEAAAATAATPAATAVAPPPATTTTAEPAKTSEPPKAAETPKAPEPTAAEPAKAGESKPLRHPRNRRPPRLPRSLRILCRHVRQYAVVGDRRRSARDSRRHRGIHRRSPAQGDEVRGQHHLGHRHQDEHRVRSTGGGVVNTGENSLASDFSREGLGNIDTDEVDPIAEAEVYFAYGRDAQAEEILKER